MSGATLSYNLRKNKHVERQLFVELLAHFARWRDVRHYLYVGFGGLYFEDYKQIHLAFDMKKMLSYEREAWMLPRQAHNVPYGSIKALAGTASDLIEQIDLRKVEAGVDNAVVWLDYVTPCELATQLSEVRALVPKLIHGDVLKITLSCHSKWLNKGVSPLEIENRLENLKELLGSQYLPDGLVPQDMTNSKIPKVYLAAVRKQLALALDEIPTLEFVPMGCYLYNDGTPMLTITGCVVASNEQQTFADKTLLARLPNASPNWELHVIDVPDLSLRERLDIDSKLDGEPIAAVASRLSYQLEPEPDESLRVLMNYARFYRYYPNYHRVQV